MDAFVFPSRTDTFGLVILEAMASGVPVILAPETGERVGIEDGVSGFLSEDFAVSLQRLMHDLPLRLAMSGAARKLANRKSWHVVFEQLYRTYAEGLTIEDRGQADKETRHFRNGMGG
jgi:glycosyltransferase involved in cell wall biosynthesis